jgi:hypothetical protein
MAHNNYLAANLELPKINFFGPIGNFLEGLTDITSPINLVNKGIGIAIGLLTSIAFIVFMFLFFIAGFNWLAAGGDQKKVESAGKQIYNAIICLVIVVGAISIIDVVGKILGIDVLNPLGFLVDIWK